MEFSDRQWYCHTIADLRPEVKPPGPCPCWERPSLRLPCGMGQGPHEPVVEWRSVLQQVRYQQALKRQEARSAE
jgi:hypothetical protein